MSLKFARDAMRSAEIGVSRFTYEPGARMPFGHSHREQEEAYVVVAGSGRATLDDEVIALAAWDGLRVTPAVIRSFDAGPDGLDLICIGSRRPEGGDNQRFDDPLGLTLPHVPRYETDPCVRRLGPSPQLSCSHGFRGRYRPVRARPGGRGILVGPGDRVRLICARDSQRRERPRLLVIEEHVDSRAAESVRLREALPELDIPDDVLVISEEQAQRRAQIKGTTVATALAESSVVAES